MQKPIDKSKKEVYNGQRCMKNTKNEVYNNEKNAFSSDGGYAALRCSSDFGFLRR